MTLFISTRDALSSISREMDDSFFISSVIPDLCNFMS